MSYPVEKQHSQPELLSEALLPKDSFVDGVYWADLPSKERSAWSSQQFKNESVREFKSIRSTYLNEGAMQPFKNYFNNYVINGMGLFVEGYVLFSIGNLAPLFAVVWPTCWSTHKVCDVQWINAVTYLEIVGIIFGQVVVGVQGDYISRRFGLIQDAIVMLLGVILLTAVWGVTLEGWVIAYALSLFIYGFGVGGEYPMTSTASLERGLTGGPAGTTDDRLHRGRRVVLSFLMQGWGQVLNQVVLLICLVAFTGGQTSRISVAVGQAVYRVSFFLVLLLHAWLVYYRIYKLKGSESALRKAKTKRNTSGYDTASLKLVLSHSWHRLLASSGGWFANDFFFYGNKLFSGVFIKVIAPGAGLLTIWEFNLINIVVSLAGYYCAALLIDHKSYGRKRMQMVGFALDFLLFLFGAIFFASLQEAGTHVRVFQAMYYLSSFFNQFGPNCTTFLVAAEMFPVSIRSTAHGFSAAVGKLGALAPTILYHYIDNQTKFYVVPWFGLAGLFLTYFFLPDTTGLDLREQERYWEYVCTGRESEYHGVAIHPRHLSWYERVILKRDRFYDPVLDKESKINDLRILYESYLIANASEETVNGSAHENEKSGESRRAAGADEDHAFISEDVARYFESEEPREARVQHASKKEEELASAVPTINNISLLHETVEIEK